jgi:hypothetical protein
VAAAHDDDADDTQHQARDTDNVIPVRFRALKDLGRARPADWERMRAAQPEAWREWLPQFEIVARKPDFPHNLDAQVLILTFLHHFGDLALSAGDNILPHLLMKGLGIEEERLRYLIALPRVRDLRSALKARRPSITRPTYPDEALFPKTGWLGTYLKYTRESEAPPAWHFWCGVSVLAAAARRNLYTDIGEYYLYPNHAIVLVGASALGKGLATAPARSILSRLNQYHDEYLGEQFSNMVFSGHEPYEDRSIVQIPGKTNANQLIHMLAVPHDRTFLDPRGNQLVARRKQSIGFLLNDELSSLLGKDNFGVDDLIRILTAYYNCDDEPIVQGTIARGIERPRDVALNILGGSTLEWLNTGITEAAFEGGFMSRVLYVTRPAANIPFYPDGAPTRDPLTRDALARSLLPWVLLGETELEFHPKAMAVHRQIRERCQFQIENPSDARLVPYYKRKRNHIVKLAQVLTMSDIMGEFGLDFTADDIESMGTSLPIFDDVLKRAWEIIEFEERYIEPCFLAMGQTRESSFVDEIYVHLRGYCHKHGRGMKITELQTWMRKKFGIKYMDYYKSALAEGLVHQVVARNKHGGPSTYVYDPKILTPPTAAHPSFGLTPLGKQMREYQLRVNDERAVAEVTAAENVTHARVKVTLNTPTEEASEISDERALERMFDELDGRPNTDRKPSVDRVT